MRAHHISGVVTGILILFNSAVIVCASIAFIASFMYDTFFDYERHFVWA